MEAKRVKITLPKDCKATGVNAKVIDDAIIVEYIPEKKYIPKDGDIVYAKILSAEWIFVSRGENEGGLISSYCALDIPNKILSCDIEILADKRDVEYMRPATEQEKKMLFDALKEKGLRWNTEKKEIEKLEFSPKNGDVIYMDSSQDHVERYILFNKTDKNLIMHGYFSYEVGQRLELTNTLYDTRLVNLLRPATAKEKAELFHQLNEAGYQWNAIEKKIEKIRWVPKHGETYYYISILGYISKDKNIGWPIDKTRISLGNCFPTEEESQECRDKVKDIFKNR